MRSFLSATKPSLTFFAYGTRSSVEVFSLLGAVPLIARFLDPTLALQPIRELAKSFLQRTHVAASPVSLHELLQRMAVTPLWCLQTNVPLLFVYRQYSA